MDWPNLRTLVTGATGSFGFPIVRHLLDKGVKEVRVLSRDEKKQFDMRNFFSGRKELNLVIGDIRNREGVDEAMKGIDIVFQAAALKQVPACEKHPMEAIRTNVLGVENVVQSALAHGVKKMICISTDKAVKPVNVMGLTKSLQEKLVLQGNLSRNNQGTILACVRYGNVLRSRGSVVPFFRSLLAQKKTLTITDKAMTRFLLTLNDAIDLVLYAVEHAQGGDIYVRKSPAAQVLDMAAILSEEAGVPLDYKIIGNYPGEKLHEILLSEEELERVEDQGDYYRIHPWWSGIRPRGVSKEYCSADAVTDIGTIRQVIARADREFEGTEMIGGEFSKI